MDLTKLFAMQRELDEAISQRNDLSFENTNKAKEKYNHMKLLALLVETAEFANEVQSFKYWKYKKEINHEKVLEEFADILHFLGSFAYKYEVYPMIDPLIISEDINVQIGNLFSAISSSMNNINKYNIAGMIALALGCAKLLNYSEEEIMKWYHIKNQKNYERIKNHY